MSRFFYKNLSDRRNDTATAPTSRSERRRIVTTFAPKCLSMYLHGNKALGSMSRQSQSRTHEERKRRAREMPSVTKEAAEGEGDGSEIELISLFPWRPSTATPSPGLLHPTGLPASPHRRVRLGSSEMNGVETRHWGESEWQRPHENARATFTHRRWSGGTGSGRRWEKVDFVGMWACSTHIIAEETERSEGC